MISILADISLPYLDMAFPKPFVVTPYSNTKELRALLPEQDVLLCRSTLQVNEHLLKVHKLQIVATASSGIDHLDSRFLSSQSIEIVDAKGSNSSAVADYLQACLAFLDQHHKIPGKLAGIIGMGKVGSEVYSRLKALGFQILCYDPPKAQLDQRFQSCDFKALYEVDLLCIHAHLHAEPPYPSIHLIEELFLKKIKPNCVIINAARGGLVNEQALLNTSSSLIYCTDVYCNEPLINEHIVDRATLCTPHIAGHSIEAKREAILMISRKLHQLFKLNEPVFKLPDPNLPSLGLTSASGTLTWQEQVLSLYNPIEETLALKQAPIKEIAFLNLRKNHQKRHDFSYFKGSFKY